MLAHGPTAVVYAVCDQVVDAYEEVVDELVADVDEVEMSVFSEERTNDSARIYVLKRELAEVRRAGWAKNREEWRDGVCAAAVPIFDATRAVAGSLSVTVPTPRFTQTALRERLVPALKKTGAALSEEIARGMR